jgi:hypothetical protein
MSHGHETAGFGQNDGDAMSQCRRFAFSNLLNRKYFEYGKDLLIQQFKQAHKDGSYSAPNT